MSFQAPPIILCIIAVGSGCTTGQHEQSGSNPPPELADAAVSNPTETVAVRESNPLGEIVQHLGDHLWIVFQDKRGVYWFGSDGQGVYRVDAQNITHFTTKDGLCNDRVRQFQEDESGNIFVNTCGGISRFDGRTFSTLTPSSSSASSAEWKLQPGDLWFRGNQDDRGPLRWDGETLHRLEFPRHALDDMYRAKFPNVPYSPYATYIVCKDSQGSVWFGTACFGACRFDGRSFTWVSEDELTELDDGPSLGVRGIVEDKDGKFWFSNTVHRYEVPAADSTAQARGAAAYEIEPGIVDQGAPGESPYSTFMSGVRGRDGALWLATYGAGVWRYDGQNVTRYPVVEGEKPVLLYSILEDDAGVLWLGSSESGAYRFDGQAFERFRP